MADTEHVLQRLEAVEAQLAITQLAARYAIAVDGRDLDALVELFVDDVNTGTSGIGRAALRAVYEQSLLRFYRSMHHVGGQTIELTGPDTASGRVYCRAEHEVADRWVIILMCYHDDYERRDGVWLFRRRRPYMWLGSDWLRRPTGTEWVDWEGARSAVLPQKLPEWRAFWDMAGADAEQTVTSFPA